MIKYILLVLAIIFIMFYIFINLVFNKIFYKYTKDYSSFIDVIKKTNYYNKIITSSKELEKIKFEDVYINSIDNTKLKGSLYIGNNDKIIIFAHGYKSNGLIDFSVSALDYYNQGYSMLFINQRAHTGSSGKYITFGVLERIDIQKWIEYISKRLNKKIILCGVSMGASSILFSLALPFKGDVRCVICDCGFSNPKDEIYHHLTKKLKWFGKLIFPFISFLYIIKIKESLDVDISFLQKSNIPVFIAHSEDDKVVPVENAYKIKTYLNDKSVVLITKHGGHGLSYLSDNEEYKQKLYDFIDTNTK